MYATVPRSAPRSSAARPGIWRGREPEVEHDDPPAARHQHIRGLDVAVQPPLGVKLVEHLGHLAQGRLQPDEMRRAVGVPVAPSAGSA